MFSDLRFRLRALFRRDDMERELDDELRFHLEREVEKHVRAGLPRAEAERRARLEFGGLERIKDDARDARGVRALDALLQDVRYGWRGMKAKPGFTAAVVLTLGLGVGANAAMFGIVDRLLFRPPAFLQSPERVHRVYLSYLWDGSMRTERNFAYRRYLELQEHTTSFEAAAAFAYRTVAFGTGEQARETTVGAVSASLFEFFDVSPVLGRLFTAQEDHVPAGERVAVLGYGFWQAEFGGREDVLGETLHIGNASYTIIGVAARGFTGISDQTTPAAFVPITAFAYARAQDYADNYGWSWLEILMRRKPDVTEAAAMADLSRAWERSWEAERVLVPSYPPAADARLGAELASTHLSRGPDAGPDAKVVAWVMGVAVIVLLIACANVVNLLLARAVHRRREIALRLALGVTRTRLWQQLLTETAMIAVLGGFVGLAAAQWGGGAIRALFLAQEDAGAVATDTRTLLFTGAITLALALLTGLAPGLQALRSDVAATLKAGMRDSTYRSSRLRTSLLLFQAALSVVLLVGAGLFVRSLANVRSYRLGYDVDPNVVIGGNLRGLELRDAEANALADRLLAAATGLPGVRGATLVVSVPFMGSEGRGAPFVPGVDSIRKLGRFTLQAGSPTYFEVTGTRIVRGRGFSTNDVATSQPVVVINRAMANAIWPGQDAIGQQMRIGPDTLPFLTVVGIAENMRGRQFSGDPEFWYYLPMAQYRALFGAAFGPYLFVRIAGDPDDFVPVLRQRLQREMPGAAYINALPLRELVAPQQRAWQFGATMFVAFAALALVLAAIGLYSVIAYTVAQRTRELGVRIALGASVGTVLRMIVRQGVIFALAGVTVGSAVALFASRWVEPLLFSTSARDPAVFAAVAAILLLVSCAATVRPALRATRVDPTITLRAE